MKQTIIRKKMKELVGNKGDVYCLVVTYKDKNMHLYQHSRGYNGFEIVGILEEAKRKQLAEIKRRRKNE